MRKVLAVLLYVSVVAVGCDSDDDIDSDGDGVPDDSDDDGGGGGGGGSAAVNEWRATVPGSGPYALEGSALVRQNVGDTTFTASLTIRGDAPGAVRPWHVHVGNCGSGGAIVGNDTDYPRLSIDSSGAAAGDVRINAVLDPAAPYHVNVHESDLYFTTIIACGDLAVQ